MKNYSSFYLAVLMSCSLSVHSASAQTGNETAVESPSPLPLNATAPLFVAFKDGVLATSRADADWQLSISRTQFQTNSGTSGSGQVGVYNTASTDYDAITSCIAPSFTADVLLPASGAPGSQPTSGNALLNAWYNYDISTHTVSSKKEVYLVADGDSCFKFQILDYTSGVYSVKATAIEIHAVEASEVIEHSIDASSATDSI